MNRLLCAAFLLGFGLASAGDVCGLRDGVSTAATCGDGDAHGASLSLLQRDRAAAAGGRALLSRRAGPFADRKNCHRVPGRGGNLEQCYPDLMFLGNSKCGSTSVVAYMLAHPQVIMQTWEQGKYGWSVNGTRDSLTIGEDKHMTWEAHVFDTSAPLAEIERRNWNTAPLVPESEVDDRLQLHYTPNYLYFPDAPFNILEAYPNATSIKYFVIVREPVARAVSSWKYHRLTAEMRSFEEVVDDGIRQRRALEDCYTEALGSMARVRSVGDMPVDRQREIVDACFWGRTDTSDLTLPRDTPLTFMHAHVDKGVYVDLLRRWFKVLGRENFMVFSLEEWAENPRSMYEKVAAFAGYEAVGPNGFPDSQALDVVLSKEYNDGGSFDSSTSTSEEPSVALRNRLADFYEAYNEELFELLGRRLW